MLLDGLVECNACSAIHMKEVKVIDGNNLETLWHLETSNFIVVSISYLSLLSRVCLTPLGIQQAIFR